MIVISRIAIVLCSLLFAAQFSVQAQPLELEPVPRSLPVAQRQSFELKRNALLKRWDEFLAKKAAFVGGPSVKVGSPEAAAAAARKAELQAEAQVIVDDADKFATSLTLAIDSELVVIDNRIVNTRRELEKLTPQLLGFQSSVDEWLTLADDARTKAQVTAREVVATVLLEKLEMKKEAEVKLDEKALKNIDRLLRKRAFMDDLYAKVLTVEKLQSLATDLDVIHLLQKVLPVVAVGVAAESREREDVGKAVLKCIEVVNKDPRITLLIADGEITIDAAYGWLAHKFAGDRVKQLLSLGDDQFKAVGVLTALYKKDVDARKLLRAAKP